MPSHQAFSISQDLEVANFNIMRAAVLASERRRKEEQRVAREILGLPEVQGTFNVIRFVSLLMRKRM